MSVLTSSPPETRPSSARAAALTAGWSLAAMAVLAPLAVFVALPSGLTGLAAVIVLVIVSLDIVIAVALARVFWEAAPWLSATSSALRIAFAAVFAVAAGELLAPVDAVAFQKIWDAGLFVFGIHLVVLAVVCAKARVPRWIAALVAIAGLGYVADAVLVALAPEIDLSVASVAFVGEVVLLVWLIVRGGVVRSSHLVATDGKPVVDLAPQRRNPGR